MSRACFTQSTAIISKLFLILFCLVSLYQGAQAQEKKEMAEGHIKTQNLWREGNKGKYMFQELHFDRKGNRTEEIRFNRKGKIIFHKSYEYENDHLKREIVFDPKGNITQRSDYTYLNNILVEKKTLNGSGKIILDEQYIYGYQD